MTIERPIGAAQRLDLPYRFGVGIMLVNRQGLVWTGRRLPKWAASTQHYIWQMPQGGLKPDEDVQEAAHRELYEETGIRDAEVIAELTKWLSYDLPPHLLGIALKGRYRGQKQRWFAMRYRGDDSDIDLRPRHGRKAEFDRWRWRPLAEVPSVTVDYQRPMYEELVQVLGPLTRSQLSTL